ncbi:hypothetical protein CPB85DRAFT_120710 [Mucidula mucida]|nr:hypothetical protein CPB85DRAFT_120710 [Mucidula mucida]
MHIDVDNTYSGDMASRERDASEGRHTCCVARGPCRDACLRSLVSPTAGLRGVRILYSDQVVYSEELGRSSRIASVPETAGALHLWRERLGDYWNETRTRPMMITRCFSLGTDPSTPHPSHGKSGKAWRTRWDRTSSSKGGRTLCAGFSKSSNQHAWKGRSTVL